MKRGVVVALLLACAAGAGGGIWYQVLSGSRPGEVSEQQVSSSAGTVSGIADTYLAAAISAAAQRSGIVKYPVTVERQETRKVTSSSSRKVSEVLVKVGDAVKEGTVLMRYDDENDEMTIQSQEYDIEKMKLDIETRTMSIQKAEAELPKLRGLELEERKVQIEQTKNAIAQNEYNIEQREKNIETLQQMTSEKEVKSKYVGIVTKVQKGTGSGDDDSDSDSSDVSQYTITIAESQNLLLKGTATEANISNIFQGQSVIAYSRVDPEVCWYGMISRVKKPGESNKESSDTGEDYSDSSGSSGSSYTYYVELEKEDGLLVGQHLYIEPDMGQAGRTEGLWIDERFFTTEDGETYAWVENANNRIEKRKVRISAPDEYGKVQVLEGLDRLEYIAESSANVKDGMRTRHADEAVSASGQTGGSGSPAGAGAYEDDLFIEQGEGDDFEFAEDDFEIDDSFLDLEDGGDGGEAWDDGESWDDGGFDDGGDWEEEEAWDDGGDWEEEEAWDDGGDWEEEEAWDDGGDFEEEDW